MARINPRDFAKLLGILRHISRHILIDRGQPNDQSLILAVHDADIGEIGTQFRCVEYCKLI